MHPRVEVLQKAWPIILANASVPLLGLADTAIIGQFGSVQALGALAIANLIFNFLYWAFGFLRMATTGYVAQAHGAENSCLLQQQIRQALGLAFILGSMLVALQCLIFAGAFTLLSASSEVEAQAQSYFSIRIWAAPATLLLYVVNGILIGLGKSRWLLLLQISLNASNIILDFIFAAVLTWGVKGIALGTAISEWALCLIALGLLARAALASRAERVSVAMLRDRLVKMRNWQSLFLLQTWRRSFSFLKTNQFKHQLATHRDIFIRTFCLLLAFAFFTNKAASFGDQILAANHILLQLISFSAFFMDGFAFVAESKIGRAIGRASRSEFWQAMRYTSEFALLSAGILALGLLFLGENIVGFITDLATVQDQAFALLPWAALYIFVSVGAFQLDGVFIGATRAKAMRNASFMSLAVFLLLWFLGGQNYGNTGLWLCFVAYVIARALSLMLYFPGLIPKSTDP